MTDQKKLEKLFRQHYRQMYRLATMLLHDDAESKDVVHDIFPQFSGFTRRYSRALSAYKRTKPMSERDS